MEVVGILVYAGILAAAMWFIAKTAVARGLLLPVAVALAVRGAVLVAAHATSVANGKHGTFYLDDAGYARVAWRIAESWRHGNATEAATAHIVNAFGGPLYYDFVAALFFLVGPSKFLAEIAGVILGALATLLAGGLAKKVIGVGAARPMAWATALMPTVVWWSVPMLKEALIVPLVLGVLLAAKDLPTKRATLITAGLLIVTAAVRLTFALALSIPIVTWFVLASFRSRADRLGIVIRILGGAVLLLIVVAVIPTGGAVWRAPHVYIDTISRLRHAYSDSATSSIGNRVETHGILSFLGGMARMLFSPRAWAADSVPFDWYQPLFFGMWFWYCTWGLILNGLWRLRRSPFAQLSASAVLAVVAIYAFTGESGVRQRSALEPILLLFAVAGASSIRSILASTALGFLGASTLVLADTRDVWLALELLLLSMAILSALPLERSVGGRSFARRAAVPCTLVLLIGSAFFAMAENQISRTTLRSDEFNNHVLPQAPRLTLDGQWSPNRYGLVLSPGRSGSATYKIPAERGHRVRLRLWFYAHHPGLSNAVWVGRDKSHYRLVSVNSNFVGRSITLDSGGDTTWLRLTASNGKHSKRYLVLDKAEFKATRAVSGLMMKVLSPLAAAFGAMAVSFAIFRSRELSRATSHRDGTNGLQRRGVGVGRRFRIKIVGRIASGTAGRH